MAREWRLQDPGEGIHEVEIIEVHASEGDTVAEGDVVFTIETDKAAIELPSPFDGAIERIAVDAGDLIEVGTVLVTFTDEEPEARKVPTEREEEAEAPTPPSERGPAEDRRGVPVAAAPATRRLARELDVDIEQMDGSGPAGRVTDDDVRAAAAPAEAERPPAEEPAALPDVERWGPVERLPLRSVRRTTAQRMAESWRRIPHVTHHDVADVTALEDFRRSHIEDVEDGHLSLTVLVLKAAVAALKEFPRFNASLDEDTEEIIFKHYYRLGIAVDTDRGLLVPVVGDVDHKSVAELAEEVDDLIERTRAGEVSRGEMQGGSFTITNPGPLGGTGFTPIINHPQVAILGLAQARREPVAIGPVGEEQVTVRFRLPLSLAFDHRVCDGADAARFVTRIVELLEDPDVLLLEV